MDIELRSKFENTGCMYTFSALGDIFFLTVFFAGLLATTPFNRNVFNLSYVVTLIWKYCMFTFSALGDILTVFFYGSLARSPFNENWFNQYIWKCVYL